MTKNIWKVHKFGGTSVLNAERYRNVSDIIRMQTTTGPKAIVVSAMKGVTDDLLTTVELASSQDETYKSILKQVHDRHVREVSSLLPESVRAPLLEVFHRDFLEIAEILRGIWLIRNVSERTAELISGMGEVWSAQILHAFFASQGLNAEWLDARKILVVQHAGGRVTIDWPKTKEKFAVWNSKTQSDLVTVTGFVASLEDGTITTLGRNGSDYSATIFGALFESDEVFIWTDVDGVLSADPRLVPEAVILDEMSYNEVAELAYFGAKVVHPSTMAPAISGGCTVWIKNSLRPEIPGTKIYKQAKSDRSVKGFSVINKICLINVEGTGMAGVPGVAERLFGALRAAAVNVILISQGSSEQSICLAIGMEEAEKARRAVEQIFAIEIQNGLIQNIQLTRDVDILAAVGDNMAHSPGISGRLFTALGRSGVNVRAIAQGSCERNISVVIDSKDSMRALRTVHSSFILPHQRVSLGVIGTGLIGGTFLRQLKEQQQDLRQNQEIDFQVRAIANSKKMLLSEKEIPLAQWENLFASASEPLNLKKLAEHVNASHIPHAALIEATASSHLTPFYKDWLRQGLHIVTPNKKANTASMPEYREIRRAAKQAGRHFLYSTNVGAGLPILQTLRDLCATGDEIATIQGILSGTLSFIFNQFDGSEPFSVILLRAKRDGYTEPDPREDLSGQDVARKIVILAREMDIDIEVANVSVDSLVPTSLQSVPESEFLQRVQELDEPMAKRLAAAKSAGQMLRFVGTVEADGTARVALENLSASHVFAQASGTDNMVLFRSKRYCKQPLIVQGPGAGPEVTAAGVFADLLRLSRYLGAAI